MYVSGSKVGIHLCKQLHYTEIPQNEVRLAKSSPRGGAGGDGPADDDEYQAAGRAVAAVNRERVLRGG